jgi:hypothetical protein
MRKSFIRISTFAALMSVPMYSISQSTTPPNSLPGYGAVSNWGCEVMLCLADPNGPMDKAECRPPIQKLYKALFKWKPQPFPVCLMSNGSNSKNAGNFAQVGPPSYYDACPAGTNPLPSGEVAYLVPPTTTVTGTMPVSQSAVTAPLFMRGIGDGSGFYPGMGGESGDTMPQKICVGPVIGQTTYSTGGGESAENYTANVYSKFAVLEPSSNSFTIEVYINGQLHKTVRPGAVQ